MWLWYHSHNLQIVTTNIKSIIDSLDSQMYNITSNYVSSLKHKSRHMNIVRKSQYVLHLKVLILGSQRSRELRSKKDAMMLIRYRGNWNYTCQLLSTIFNILDSYLSFLFFFFISTNMICFNYFHSLFLLSCLR